MRARDIPITAWIGMAGIAIAFIFALFAPWIAPYGETQVVGDVWQLPDDKYIFGLDNLGRDILSRLIYGARTTLLVASAATIISFSLGVILSFTAAVSRGLIDTVFSRFNDLMMSIPTLIFALVVLAVLPQNLVVLILVMAILDSTRVYRLGRAVALDVAVMEFVEAAKLRGEGKLWDHLPRDPAETRCRRCWPSSDCASPSRSSSSRRCPSSASAFNRRRPIGAAWSRTIRTASSSASRQHWCRARRLPCSPSASTSSSTGS